MSVFNESQWGRVEYRVIKWNCGYISNGIAIFISNLEFVSFSA